MSTDSKHRGVIVPMVTPFNDDGSLDEQAAAKLVDHLASNNMGVFVLGTTGEAASMTQATRRRLVEIAVATAGPRALVYAGIGDNCVDSSISAARDYLALGAHAVVAHLPSYYLLNDEEMYSYFEYIAGGIGGSLVIYNMPQTTRMSLPIPVLERLALVPGIIGLKDSENSPGRLELTAERLCGRDDFSVFMGVAALSAKALKAGFDGLVPSSGNIVPDKWDLLLKAAENNEWELVESLQTQLNAIAAVFQKNRSLAQSLGALKACLATLNLCSSKVLPPLHRPDSASCAQIAEELPPLLAS